MTYDVAISQQQALDPSACTTIDATLHAIGAAITHCRNAGKDSATDPAVLLLARHLGTVCAGAADNVALRRMFLDQIAEIRRHPVLRTLAYRGVSENEAAKRVFHREGRAAMRRLTTSRSEDGVIMRHRVCSTAFKAKPTRGEPEQWVTIAPVAQAIAVLERLAERAGDARGIATLWPVLPFKTGTKSHVSAEIVRQLNAYRDYLNALFGSTGQPIIPPGPNGAPWRITTRQFRRTIAWHIATGRSGPSPA